jgi:hypothetical protein
MSSVVISGDTSGAITLAAPAVAGTNTINLPAAAGTVMVSGNMPAFYASKVSANQALTTNVYSKITFDTELFDTNNNFASSTFTPTVAGYYQFNACLYFYSNSVNTRVSIQLKKNNSISYFGQYLTGQTSSDYMITASNIFYMNGTTDYMEVFGVATSVGTIGVYSDANSNVTYFTGALIRAA